MGLKLMYPSPDSPCIRGKSFPCCRVDRINKVCLDCRRTVSEIVVWSRLPDSAKSAINRRIQELKPNKEKLDQMAKELKVSITAFLEACVDLEVKGSVALSDVVESASHSSLIIEEL